MPVDRSALVPQLARYSEWFEFAPVGYVALTNDGVIAQVNAAAENLLGMQRVDLAGKPLIDFVSGDEYVALKVFLSKVLDSAVPHRCTVAFNTVGRAAVKVDLQAKRSANGLECHVAMVDVSQHLLAEQRLTDSEARTGAIIESAMDAILTVDDAQRIVLFNQAAATMFGCASAEAIGQPLERFIPPRLRASHQGHMRAFGESRATSRSMGQPGQVAALRANGEEFPVEAAISHAAVNGRQLFTVILRDISERKRAQAAIERSHSELRELSRAANAAIEAERKRIARELHDELGQLITVARMDLEALRSGFLPEQLELQSKAQNVRAALDGVVAAARRIASDLRPTLLDDLGLAAALEWLMQSFAERTQIDVKLFADDSLPDVHEPVASALYRVAQESLTNIARHAKASSAQVRLEQVNGSVMLTVRDNGSGINEASLGKSGSFGVRGMRERVGLLGGEFSVGRLAGGGTELRARLPNLPDRAGLRIPGL